MAVLAFFAQMQGQKALMKILSGAKKQAENPGKGLRRLGEEIITESVKITPIEFGRLRGSKFVRQVSRTEVQIGYGVDYAIYVHEVPATHKAPTTWKFLERPAKARFNKTPIELANDPVLRDLVNFDRL